MVSKKYIPIGERSIRGREKARTIENDTELQAPKQTKVWLEEMEKEERI